MEWQNPYGIKKINTIYKYSEKTANEYNDDQHDPKNFTGTTSKSVIFEKDGKILKYKSISSLSKNMGLSKYQILKGFKPKKHGDSFFYEKLGGTLTFVDRKEYNK